MKKTVEELAADVLALAEERLLEGKNVVLPPAAIIQMVNELELARKIIAVLRERVAAVRQIIDEHGTTEHEVFCQVEALVASWSKVTTDDLSVH